MTTPKIRGTWYLSAEMMRKQVLPLHKSLRIFSQCILCKQSFRYGQPSKSPYFPKESLLGFACMILGVVKQNSECFQILNSI